MPRYVTIDIDAIRDPGFRSIMEFWQQRRSERLAPAWNRDVHFLDFDSAVIPRMILVQLDGLPGIGIYRFWGTGVKTYEGSDQTGGRVNTQETPEMADDMVAQYEDVIASRVPRCYATRVRLRDTDLKYEASLRLPFSDDGERIDRVLSIDLYAKNWSKLTDALGVTDLREPA